MRKLLVVSQKGGVGKTTTSMNLAAATALTGTRVLLLDADPLCNISAALKLAEHPQRQPLRQAAIDLPGIFVPNVIPGLDVLSPYDEGTCTDEDFAQILRAVAAPPIGQSYGCLLIDVPPFLGGSAAPLLASCDDFLLVLRAEEMAYRTFPAFQELIQRSSPDGRSRPMCGILLTLPEGEEPGCRLERELRGRFGSRLLAEVIPHDPQIVEALQSGSICSQRFPESPAARQYHQLAAKLELAAAGASPSMELEVILQVLREAVALASSTASETPPRTDCPTPEPPLFAPYSETVKSALPSHRPRRLGRSADSVRPAARTERGGQPSLAPPPHAAHALAQLWPLWILLGAVLGGGMRLLPLSPSLLPVLIGLGAALLVVVVLSVMAKQKCTAPSVRTRKSGLLRSRQIKKPKPITEPRQDALSARLTSLINDTKRARRSPDAN